MGKKSIILLLLFVISPVAVYILWPTDEARIREVVRKTASAVESEDIDGVMSAVNFGYQDSLGMNYLLLKRTLTREFSRLSDIKAEYEGLRIEVKERAAKARLDIRVIATRGKMRGYYLGDFDTPFVLTLMLEKSPAGRWLVVGSEYQHGPL